MKRFLICLALAAAACGGESTSAPPPKPTISGTWNGVSVLQPTSLTLLETNGTVTGTGIISGTPVGVRALTVSGIFTSLDFSLTLSSGTAQPINFKGKLNTAAPHWDVRRLRIQRGDGHPDEADTGSIRVALIPCCAQISGVIAAARQRAQRHPRTGKVRHSDEQPPCACAGGCFVSPSGRSSWVIYLAK